MLLCLKFCLLWQRCDFFCICSMGVFFAIIAFRFYSSIMCDDEVIKIMVVLWRGYRMFFFCGARSVATWLIFFCRCNGVLEDRFCLVVVLKLLFSFKRCDNCIILLL